MPHLLIPIVKELFGISLSSFKVTDKSGGGSHRRKRDWRSMMPFLILIGMSTVGIIRLCLSFKGVWSLGLVILLFWIFRNLYFLLMAVFLIDGRDEDGEAVHVYDAEQLTVQKKGQEKILEGISTHLTEHSFSFFLDEEDALRIGDSLDAVIMRDHEGVKLSGIIISQRRAVSGGQSTYTMEIIDFNGMEEEYLQILYDRVPTLPQNLNRDFGKFRHLWVNIANRIGRIRG